MDNLKCFLYKGDTIYYFLKNIELKDICGKEMASAYMVVCDKEGKQKDVFHVYRERYEVLYAMEQDVCKWYEDHLKKKGEV